MRKRVALVTGGTGFTGSNLVKNLILSGWTVNVIVRPNSNLELLEKYINHVVLHVHDASTMGMIGIVKCVKPDVTFHLAALAMGEHKPKDLESILQSNIIFSTQLVEAMSVNEIKNFVNVGTYWQHYHNHAYAPTCLYAATKQAFEAILQYYIEVKMLKVITLVLFDSYGPNDPRGKIINLLRGASNSKQPLQISPGDQLMDLVYIDDIIAAFEIAAQRLLDNSYIEHERYSVSSSCLISLKELVQIYEGIANVKLPIQWGARPYRDREVMQPWNRGKLLPNWKPTVSIVEGLKNILRK
jgi:nucleoside-diphosphate-sugar epimerase